MTFTGLSNYRRTRQPGLVAPMAFYKRELIVNGTFDSDVSGWTATAPATITWNAVGACDIARNGAAIGTDMCYQVVGVVAGHVYWLSFDLLAKSNTMNVYVSFDGGTTDTALFSSNVSTLTTYTIGFKATGSTLRLIFKPTDSASATCRIDNVSLKDVIGLY